MFVPILAYHKVSNEFELGINSIPIRTFESQINYLANNHYYSISLDRYIQGNFQINSVQSPIIITFDDADESVYHYAFPILKLSGFTATVFVISNYVGKRNSWDANLGGIYSRHLNWEQINELVHEGWEIGSHTVTHPDLLTLSSSEVTMELQCSKDMITTAINKPVQFLSYPFNRFDYRVTAIAQQVGYRGGCALSPQKKLNGSMSYFNIQRFGVYKIDALFWFKQKLSNSKIERLKQRIISHASIGTIWYNQLRK